MIQTPLEHLMPHLSMGNDILKDQHTDEVIYQW